MRASSCGPEVITGRLRAVSWRASGRHAGARLAAIAIGIAIAIAIAPAAPASASGLPSFESVRDGWRSSEARLTDRRGETLQTLRIDASVRRLQWVRLHDVSPAFRAALLRSEDRRFLEHSGIDWQAVGGAIAQAAGAASPGGRPVRGASTITMQLAGMLSDPARTGRRNWPQKLDQALGALALERAWSKDQILEAYLNLVGFRGELVGLAALSELLFGKDASALTAQEGAIAAALVRAPNASAAVVARRACLLLVAPPGGGAPVPAGKAMLAAPCAGLDTRVTAAFAHREPVSPLAPALAPHLARRLLREPGQVVRSTLDARVQRLARETLGRHVREMARRNVHDGAVVVLDNASGDVLAWVGASGATSEAPQVDAVTAPRQAGSTLKPFLYAQALAERRLTAASLLEDRPLDVAVGGGLYGPQNYDRGYKGTVSVRTALASSLNVPAVRTAMLVTPVAFAPTLRRLGLVTVDRPGDHYGLSLALGSADVTLLDLANAYRALANGGLASPLRLRTDMPRGTGAPVRALDPAAAFIVADILADRNARARTFGWDSPLALRTWAAVKTGTSKDMRDNWCVGFSRRFTVGVWIGNAAGEPMWDVSGVSGAAPVWADIMRALDESTGVSGEPGVAATVAAPVRGPPAPPPGVIRVAVRFADRLEPDRDEWFVPGTEQHRVARAVPGSAPAIVAPVDGTRMALDPDIPPRSQRVRFAASGAAAQARWVMDGRELGRGAQLWWFPMPGHHRLELRGAAGEVYDRVSIEVRGAWRAEPR